MRTKSKMNLAQVPLAFSQLSATKRQRKVLLLATIDLQMNVESEAKHYYRYKMNITDDWFTMS
jgi:hypothetical protein